MKIKNKRLFFGVLTGVVLVLAATAYFIYQSVSADTLTGGNDPYSSYPITLNVKLSPTSTAAKAAPYKTNLKADLDWAWNATRRGQAVRSLEAKFYCTDQDKLSNTVLETKKYSVPAVQWVQNYTGSTSITTTKLCSYSDAGVNHPYVSVTAYGGKIFNTPTGGYNPIVKYATINIAGEFVATLDVTSPDRLEDAYAPFKTGFAVGHSPAISDSSQAISRSLYCKDTDTVAVTGSGSYPYSLNPKIFASACTYNEPGTYKAKAVVKRDGKDYVVYKEIVVKQRPVTPTPTPTPTRTSSTTASASSTTTASSTVSAVTTTPTRTTTASTTTTTSATSTATRTATATKTATTTQTAVTKFTLALDVDNETALKNAKAPFTTGFKVSYTPKQATSTASVYAEIFCTETTGIPSKTATFAYKDNPQTFTNVCTYSKAGTYTAVVLAKYNNKQYRAEQEIVVAADNSITQTVTLKKGFNIFGTGEGTVSPNAFSVKGLTTYGFNVPNTQYGWVSWPPSQKLSILPGRGYYVYNPGAEVKITVPVTPLSNVRRVYPKWNLLYSDKDAKLSDIPVRLADVFIQGTKSQIQSKCVIPNKTLQDLMNAGTTYKTVFVIDNPQATKACQAFKVLGTTDKASSATCSNSDITTYGTVSKIPAGKAFWVYLWPDKVTSSVTSAYKEAQAEEAASSSTVSQKCISTQ